MFHTRQKKIFYVVQFIEFPHEGIDDFVVVPHNWLVLHKFPKTYVTYPKNEDLCVTQERVKRREEFNKRWKFYKILIKYRADDYNDAECWIALKNGHRSNIKKLGTKGTQLERVLDNKLQSTTTRFWSNTHSDKPQLSVKPSKKKGYSRNLLLANKCLKSNGNVEPGIVTDSPIISSECSRQTQSIIITDNELIENELTQTSSAFNSATNTEQSTKSEVNKEDQSDTKIIATNLTKLRTEKLSLRNLAVEQQPLPKLSTEQQHLSDENDEEQTLVIDLDQSNKDIDGCLNCMPDHNLEKKLSIETISIVQEQDPQLKPVNKTSIPSACHAEVPTDIQKPDLPQILTIPTTVFTALQIPITAVLPSFTEPLQSSELPVFNSINSKLPTQNIFGKKISEVNRNNVRFRSHIIKQSSAVENPQYFVNKKTYLENIKNNLSSQQYPSNSMMNKPNLNNDLVTMQTSLAAQNQDSMVNNVGCYSAGKCNNHNVPDFYGMMNTSASQNLLNLSRHYDTRIGLSQNQQFIPVQENHLRQFTHSQEMFGGKTIVPTVSQRICNPNSMINGGFCEPSQPNTISQPIQFLPPNANRYLPVNRGYAQEGIRNEQMKQLYGGHTMNQPNVQNEMNIQLAAYNLSNHNFQLQKQRQDRPNLRIASTQNDHFLKTQFKSRTPEIHEDTKRLRSLYTPRMSDPAFLEVQKNIILSELGLQRRDKSSTEYSTMIQAVVPGNLTKPQATMQDSKTQEIPLADQSTSVEMKYVDQHFSRKRNLIDQANETELIMNIDQYSHEITESVVNQSCSTTADSACQTNESFGEDTGSPYQEISSYLDTTMEHEIESENKVVLEDNRTNLTNVKNVPMQDQSITTIKQEMLDVYNVLTKMRDKLSYTRDIFNCLGNSMLQCSQKYETLLEKVNKFNSLALCQIPTPLPENETSQVSQVTQRTLSGDNRDAVSINDASKQSGMLSLPAEYDSNDTTWTLKYRENKPGLMELLPRSSIYVSKKELRRCIKESSDCRSLARLLLSEVFNKKALSVCSLTGGKGKALSSFSNDARPELDEHARLVLLVFVEEYGKRQRWNFDVSDIISSIQTKIHDTRAKYGEKCKV